MASNDEKDPEVGTVPIRRAPKNVMLLRQDGANGRLPDGRKFDISSTCGLGGVSLVLCVYSADGRSGTGGSDGGMFTVDGREMIESLIARGQLAPEAISGQPPESDRAQFCSTLDSLGLIAADLTTGAQRAVTEDDREHLLAALAEMTALISAARAKLG